MVRHPISQTSGVKIRPLAGIERGFVRKSGARDAGFGVLRLKYLGMDSLKVMNSRDMVDEIMVWNCCVERL
jgi:hypothetical protein